MQFTETDRSPVGPTYLRWLQMPLHLRRSCRANRRGVQGDGFNPILERANLGERPEQTERDHNADQVSDHDEGHFRVNA